MGIVKEFKEFAVKGNMIDMAVGIIIGGAFGKIVSSLVGDVIMPAIGMIVGGVDFTGLKIVLKEAQGTVPAATLNYGMFIQQVVDFLIVAAAIFAVVKGLNALKREKPAAPAAPPAPKEEIVLLGQIRDLLKNK